MTKTLLKLGTRKSELALWQAHHIRDTLLAHWGESLEIELVKIVTEGDRILDRPLAEVGGKGLFVNGIEERLLTGEIDFAVHSMKDLPSEVPAGLAIVATPERADPRDALVGPKGQLLASLSAGTRIGTSSLRRSALLKRINPGLEVVSIRGNVPTRIRKIDDGVCDAVILAASGLDRLERGGVITERLDPETFVPAAAQGILAIEARSQDASTLEFLAILDHERTHQCARAERAFLARLEGGCQVPMGCFAQLDESGERLRVHGMLGDPSGRPYYEAREEGPVAEAEQLGRLVADALLELGGGAIIAALS
jgi:hydroxymethylbilane synthase